MPVRGRRCSTHLFAFSTALRRGVMVVLAGQHPVGGILPSQDAQGSALLSAKLTALLVQLRQIVPDAEEQSR
jgi:hypothetical protein